jgi:hypothetical protein
VFCFGNAALCRAPLSCSAWAASTKGPRRLSRRPQIVSSLWHSSTYGVHRDSNADAVMAAERICHPARLRSRPRGPSFAIGRGKPLVQRRFGSHVNLPTGHFQGWLPTRVKNRPVAERSFRRWIYAKTMTPIDSLVILKDWRRSHRRLSCLSGRIESPLVSPPACCGTHARGTLSAALDAG